MNYSDAVLAYNWWQHGMSIAEIAAHFDVTADDVYSAISFMQGAA